jgi:hypothetical protein
MPMKKSMIEDKIYHARIWTLSNYTGDEIRRYFKQKYDVKYDFKENGNDQWATHFSVVNKDNSDVRHYICIQKFEWTIAQQCLLVHEIYHLMNSIFRDVGMEPCKETEEAYAYYLQYLAKGIFRSLLKDANLLKKKK